MKKIKKLLIGISIIIFYPFLISFSIIFLYLFFILNILSILPFSTEYLNEIFGKIAVIFILILNPLIGTIIGYIYLIKNFQIKMKILFTLIYFIVAFILALLASAAGSVVIVHPPS